MEHNFSDWDEIYYFIKENFDETKKYQESDFINFLQTIFDTGFSEGEETGRNFGYEDGYEDGYGYGYEDGEDH